MVHAVTVFICPGGRAARARSDRNTRRNTKTRKHENTKGTTDRRSPERGHAWAALPALVLAALAPAAAPARAAQTLYASNYRNNTIERITPGGAASVFDTNTGAQAGSLNGPFGLAFDSGGNLYAANSNGSTIEEITPSGVASQFASDPNGPRYLAFSPAASAAPEPSQAGVIALMTLGLGGLLLRARRRQARA